MLRWARFAFIRWVVRHRRHRKREVVRFDDTHLFWRWEPFWWDEGIKRDGSHYNRAPWWRPFNAFLHLWDPADDQGEGMHDHPRWSITICLRGRMIEDTPWASRELRPGSVVIRSRKYIHSFVIPNGHRGRTWTLFIVGRRNHPQNTYVVTSHGGKPGQLPATSPR